MSEWEADLKRLIQECRTMNDGQRFGQFIHNLVADGEPQDFHGRLFYIEDSELVEKLEGQCTTGN